jgi:hypothetical protein
VSGWTNTVSSYLSGARTLKEKDADLLGEKVPILQQPIRKNASVVYFHTKDNPYGGWQAMKSQLAGASRDEVLCRAYGVPTKPANTVFPNLDERVVEKHDDLAVVKNARRFGLSSGIIDTEIYINICYKKFRNMLCLGIRIC